MKKQRYAARLLDDDSEVVIDQDGRVQSVERCAQLMNDREILAERAAEIAQLRAQTASEAGDRANANALNKAIWHLSTGLKVLPTTCGYLIPSGTRSGVIHRVSAAYGCSCEATQEHETRTVSYADMVAAMGELFA